MTFFHVATFPQPAAPTFYFCSPHSSKGLWPLPEKGCELAPFNQMWEQGCMNHIKVSPFSCGEAAAPFSQNPKPSWSCNAFWSISYYCGCRNRSLSFIYSDGFFSVLKLNGRVKWQLQKEALTHQNLTDSW